MIINYDLQACRDSDYEIDTLRDLFIWRNQNDSSFNYHFDS